MFRINFFVDDKNLGEAFKRLAGIAKNLEHAYVPNVENKPNGKVGVSSPDSMMLIMKELRHRKVTEFNADVVRSVISDLGFKPEAYGYFLTRAHKAGLINKKKGLGNQNMTYTVRAEK
jgi:hypothetical protein